MFPIFYVQEGQAHVSVLCEYDALPEIGHACGHNLIAECGVAAGIGIKAAMDNAGRNIGKVNNKGAHHHICVTASKILERLILFHISILLF